MSRAIKGRTAVVAAFASLAVFLGNATPSAAQTCQVAGNTIAAASNVGTVQAFGDLKVRLTRVWWSADGASQYVQFDMKAPGFAVNGVQLKVDSPLQIFTICGQEVSFAFRHFNMDGDLVVAVF